MLITLNNAQQDLATLYAADFDARKDNLMDYSKYVYAKLIYFELLAYILKFQSMSSDTHVRMYMHLQYMYMYIIIACTVVHVHVCITC